MVRGTDQFTHLCVLHIGRRYAWLCFQRVRLHSADATTIPVGSFRRDLWMFLYEAYFIWLPTMYFQCAVCAHLCLGLRSLGCGWLWDECSPRLLCSRTPSTCRSSRMYPAICGLEWWWVRLYLYPFVTGTRKQAFVWRQIPPKTHCPSFDAATAIELHFAKLGLISLMMIHYWSWSAKIHHNLKKFIEDIDLYNWSKRISRNSSGGGDCEKEINHLLHFLFSKDPQMRWMFSCRRAACSMR